MFGVYKTRLVTKGYTQTYGIGYQEKFVQVIKMNSIQVLLSVAANKSWPLQQIDVKNTFIHGDLCEEVYMMQPPWFKIPESEGKMCKLKKALYGLKQSWWALFERINGSLKKVGYQQSQVNHTLFV